MSLFLDDLQIRLPPPRRHWWQSGPTEGRLLIDGLTLDIAEGSVTTLMGPSGSGKSTLLAAIGGHLPDGFGFRGRIVAGERDITRLRPEQRRIGILFQDDLLFPHLSVGDNLAFGLAAGGRAADRRARVDAALVEADLKGFADRDPSTLSGGQRARVALLRTLLSEPQALLLDEPFSGLDPQLRGDIRQFVFGHIRARRLPTLLVTHDPADAEAAGGALVHLPLERA